MTPQHTTDELLAAQAERERIEQARARTTPEPQEAEAHKRRADKAAYLRQRLEARVAADRAEAGGTHTG